MIVGIEGRPDLVRDCSSGAILNTNRAEYENYLARREQAKRKKELLETQAAEIESLKSDIGEMKQLLTRLVESININKVSE